MLRWLCADVREATCPYRCRLLLRTSAARALGSLQEDAGMGDLDLAQASIA
jgi:hypothetical protein